MGVYINYLRVERIIGKSRDNGLLKESLIVARRGRGNIETGYARGHCVYRTEFNEENAIPVR